MKQTECAIRLELDKDYQHVFVLIRNETNLLDSEIRLLLSETRKSTVAYLPPAALKITSAEYEEFNKLATEFKKNKIMLYIYMKYAILGYDTLNIGDDIQSFVASTLIDASYIILRDDYDKIYDFHTGELVELTEPVKLIMNGWFMLNPDHTYHTDNLKFPIKNKLIHPVYISTCLSKDVPLLYTPECIEHYKSHQPIYCRDTCTSQLLTEHGVSAVFYGCLTQLLSLTNVPESAEHKETYSGSTLLVDCPQNIIEQYINEKHFVLTHHVSNQLSPFEKRALVADLFSRYRYAKKIITTRLHCFLPCRAIGIDVEFIGPICYRTQDFVEQVPDTDTMIKIFHQVINASGT